MFSNPSKLYLNIMVHYRMLQKFPTNLNDDESTFKNLVPILQGLGERRGTKKQRSQIDYVAIPRDLFKL